MWSITKLSLQVIHYRDWLNDLICQSGNDQTEKPHILIIWGTFDSLPCLPSRGGIPLQHSGPPGEQGQRTSVSSLERTVKHHTPSCYSQRVSGHWNKTRYGRCVRDLINSINQSMCNCCQIQGLLVNETYFTEIEKWSFWSSWSSTSTNSFLWWSNEKDSKASIGSKNFYINQMLIYDN